MELLSLGGSWAKEWLLRRPLPYAASLGGLLALASMLEVPGWTRPSEVVSDLFASASPKVSVEALHVHQWVTIQDAEFKLSWIVLAVGVFAFSAMLAAMSGSPRRRFEIRQEYAGSFKHRMWAYGELRKRIWARLTRSSTTLCLIFLLLTEIHGAQDGWRMITALALGAGFTVVWMAVLTARVPGVLLSVNDVLVNSATAWTVIVVMVVAAAFRLPLDIARGITTATWKRASMPAHEPLDLQESVNATHAACMNPVR